ncbi:hypothetical protein GUJ93_ZPchr0003g18561 [Zizania palustris]|uniref:Uncharacterized protein n=1 Tax=Zizania palustris TaxID=103762 RepID=A0A8J5SFW5_ZIZPA|nr:hypothetical protein GUJ93_ZPchr0003g18561 [Zizania palustris]
MASVKLSFTLALLISGLVMLGTIESSEARSLQPLVRARNIHRMRQPSGRAALRVRLQVRAAGRRGLRRPLRRRLDAELLKKAHASIQGARERWR